MSAVQELLLLLPLALLALQASLCRGACVEVESNTEAVANEGFKLGCISCKMRAEVPATAFVEWYFKALNETEFNPLLTYENQNTTFIDSRFHGRLDWNGSKKTDDLQDGSIFILNVTLEDAGTYMCIFNRTLKYNLKTVDYFEYPLTIDKIVEMKVVQKRTRGLASILSEVMMYVTLIGLQVWLVIEIVYCYRKISAAGEEALRETAAEYLAISSESKDNCAGVQVAE